MNQIIRGLLKQFGDDFGFNDILEDTRFEYFINYIIGYPYSFDRIEKNELELINVGGGSTETKDGEDGSIDGVMIFVNNVLVTNSDLLEDVLKPNGYLTVNFVFTQAKRSESFDKGDLNNFLTGVEEFLGEEIPKEFNSRLKKLHKIKNDLYLQASRFTKNPECHIFYAATGTWNESDPHMRIIDKTIKNLNKNAIFSSVKINIMDNKKIQEKWRDCSSINPKTIEFSKHQIMPKTEKIDQAFIGVIECNEFLKLLTNEEGEMIREVFYDNVRDFQGENSVNQGIKKTLANKKDQAYFALLNNGMTVMAKEIKQTGDSFTLINYQIVNGCQTSHVLFNNRDIIDRSAYIPLKLIETSDEHISEMIIRATNSQTEVKDEAFEALSEFHKTLEGLYKSYKDLYDLYYERRSKQHKNDKSIKVAKIITLPIQTKNFVGMYLNEPHSTHRYYGELIHSYRAKLFVKEHSLKPYFVSSLTGYLLEKYFNDFKVNKKIKLFKYHIMMIFKVLLCKQLEKNKKMQCDINGRKGDKVAEEFLSVLKDVNLTNKLFKKVIEILEEEFIKFSNKEYDLYKKKDFTKALQIRADEENL